MLEFLGHLVIWFSLTGSSCICRGSNELTCSRIDAFQYICQWSMRNLLEVLANRILLPTCGGDGTFQESLKWLGKLIVAVLHEFFEIASCSIDPAWMFENQTLLLYSFANCTLQAGVHGLLLMCKLRANQDCITPQQCTFQAISRNPHATPNSIML